MAPLQEPNPPEDHRAGIEGRRQQRHRCKDRLVYLAVRPSFQNFPALVHDVSANGIGFLLDRALDPGTVLALQLRSDRPGTSVIRIARVVHVRRHLAVKNAPWAKKKHILRSFLSFFSAGSREGSRDDDFIWLIGCRLSPPLSEEELHSLGGQADGSAAAAGDFP